MTMLSCKARGASKIIVCALEDIRLEKVHLAGDDPVADLLEFYMGENDNIRLDFIRNNLRSDIDNVEEAQ